MSAAVQKLQRQWAQGKMTCVGLDSDPARLPVDHLDLSFNLEELHQAQVAYITCASKWDTGEGAALGDDWARILAAAQYEFNRRIVDATKDVVAAYKPNIAFYEALGPAGVRALQQTIAYIRRVAPEVLVIIDCKRGDIDSTNRGYVAALSLADAFTVSPYLGIGALQPFLNMKDKLVFILCKTSNPDGGELQDLPVRVGLDALGEGVQKVPEWLANLAPEVELQQYKYVAHRVTHHWNVNGNCGLVVGATYPQQLVESRRIAGDKMPILLPGLGTQGGDREASIKAGCNIDASGLVVNFARNVIFAGGDHDFADDAGDAIRKEHDSIAAILAV